MDLGKQNLRAEQKGLSELWVKNTNSNAEQQQKQWNYYANQSVLVDQIPDVSTSSVWNFGGQISDVSSVKCL